MRSLSNLKKNSEINGAKRFLVFSYSADSQASFTNFFGSHTIIVSNCSDLEVTFFV